MNTFDRDEQNIREAFSQINVDTSELSSKVSNRLHEKLQPTKSGRVRWPVAIAATISAVFVVTMAVYALSGFDWLIQRLNPAFGEIIEPVGVYCEDEGIRMEVIGAQKYGNMAIVYMSLQDISGQNRLTEQTYFRDGFSVKMKMSSETSAGAPASASFGYSDEVLYFDKESNTIYYEFNLAADSNSPLSEQLELGSRRIYFDERSYQNEPVSLQLSELAEAESVRINKRSIWGGTNLPDDLGEPIDVLIPGYHGPMPHGEEDQWISNAGIVNGILHIQIGGIWNREFGSSDASLYIKSPDGEFIDCSYSLRLLTDEKYSILNLDDNDYSDAAYKYDEYIFDMNNSNLEGYTLCYLGGVSSGVQGHWKVVAPLSDTSQQIRTWTNDIYVDDHLFEHMFLSPLGFQVIGSYTGEDCGASEISLEVETTDGANIPLNLRFGSTDTQNQTFNFNWNIEAPIDVEHTTAVIINGTRIPIATIPEINP